MGDSSDCPLPYTGSAASARTRCASMQVLVAHTGRRSCTGWSTALDIGGLWVTEYFGCPGYSYSLESKVLPECIAKVACTSHAACTGNILQDCTDGSGLVHCTAANVVR